MKNAPWICKSLAVCALLALGAAVPAQQTTLLFGVYTTDNPQTVYRQFSPVAEALGERLTKTMGRPAEVQLRVFMTYESALDALAEGKIDIARFGPASYVLAKAQDPKIELLAMESVDGKKTFEGLIVVRTDSDIRSMSDLRGKSFAFGNKNSTVGRFLAQEQLLAAGISEKDLSDHDFLDRHDKVFRAVQRRMFDGGALKSSTYEKLNKHDQLRVLKAFDVPTKPWVVRSGMSKEVSAALRTALLGLEDEEALKSLKASGFVATSDEEYAVVRSSMLTALKFEPAAKPGK